MSQHRDHVISKYTFSFAAVRLVALCGYSLAIVMFMLEIMSFVFNVK